MLSPTNEATEVSLTPTLSWEDSTGEINYSINISNDPAFNSIVHNESVGMDIKSYLIPYGKLLNSTPYYWRVKAANSYGNTMASNVPYKFTTIAELPECDNSYNLSNLRNWKQDYSPEEIRNTIINTNSGLWYNSLFNSLIRYTTPIKIYTGGISYFDKAVNNIEIYTKGLISFQRVNSLDELQQGKGGIAVIHGYSETCGHMIRDNNYNDESSACRGESLGTSYAVRDNPPRCSQTDDIGIAVTEHEIMHALGMIGHFDGFKNGNDGGIKEGNQYGKNPEFARAVLMNMYQNPPGTTRENLKIPSY